MKVVKELHICSQHINDVMVAIEFNKEHDYEYNIVCHNTLIGLEGLKKLIINNYVILPYDNRDSLVLRHESRMKKKEDV